jgi:hypothetical protein
MKSKNKIDEASIASAVNGYLATLKGSSKEKNIQERLGAVLSEAKLHGEYDPNDRETVSFSGKKYSTEDRGENEDQTAGMSIVDPDKEEGNQQSSAAKEERNKLRLTTDELNKKIRQRLFNMVSTDEEFRTQYQGLIDKYKKNSSDQTVRAALQKIRDDISKDILAKHNATTRRDGAATDPKEYLVPIVSKVFKKLIQLAGSNQAPSKEMIDFGRDVLNIDLRPSQDFFQKFVNMARRREFEVSPEDVSKFVSKSLENPNSNLAKFAQSKLGSYPGTFRDKIENQADKENVPGKDEGGIGSMIKKLQIADPEYVKRRQMLQRGAMSGDKSQQDQLTKLNAEFEKNLIPQLKDVIVGRSNIESTPIARALKLISPEDAIKLYTYFKNNPKEMERSDKELDSRLPNLTAAKLPTPGSEIDKVSTIGSEIAPIAKSKSGKEISTSLLNSKEKDKIKSDFAADQKKFEGSRDLSSMFGTDEDEQPVEARPEIKISTPEAKVLWSRLIDPKNKDKKPIVGALIKTLTKALSTGDSAPVSGDKTLAVQARQALQDAESNFYDVRREMSSFESSEKQRGSLRPDEQKKKQELMGRIRDARNEVETAKKAVNKAESAYKLSTKFLQKRKDISPEEVVQILNSLIVRGATGDVTSLKDPEKVNLPDEQKAIAKNIHYILGPDRLKKDAPITGEKGGRPPEEVNDLSVSRFLEPALDDYAQSEAERDVMNYPELEQDVKDSERREFEDSAKKKSSPMKLSSDEISNIDRDEEDRRNKVSSGIKSRISDLHSEKDKLKSTLKDKLGEDPDRMMSRAKDETGDSFDDNDELDELDDDKRPNESDEDHAKRKSENDRKRSEASSKKSDMSDFEEIQGLKRDSDLKRIRKELNKKISVGDSGKKMSIGGRINALNQVPDEKRAYAPGKVDLGAAKQRMAANTQMKNKEKIDSLLKKFSESKEDSFSSIMMELLVLPGKKKLGHAEVKNQSWEASTSPRKMKLIPDFQKQTKPTHKKKRKSKKC